MAFTLRITIGGLWIAVVDEAAVHLIAPNPPHDHGGHGAHHEPHYARVVGKTAGLTTPFPFDGARIDLSKLSAGSGAPKLPPDCLSLRDVADKQDLEFPASELSKPGKKVTAHVILSGGKFRDDAVRHCFKAKTGKPSVKVCTLVDWETKVDAADLRDIVPTSLANDASMSPIPTLKPIGNIVHLGFVHVPATDIPENPSDLKKPDMRFDPDHFAANWIFWNGVSGTPEYCEPPKSVPMTQPPSTIVTYPTICPWVTVPAGS